jgi:hypothetical protein
LSRAGEQFPAGVAQGELHLHCLVQIGDACGSPRADQARRGIGEAAEVENLAAEATHAHVRRAQRVAGGGR